MNADIFIYTSLIVLAVSAGWSAWNFRKLLREFRPLAIFVLISAAVQGAAWGLASWGINNMALSHLYAVLGFAALARFYSLLLKPFISRAFFNILTAGFGVLSVTAMLLWEPLSTLNSISLTVEAVLCIILALSTFLLTVNEALNQHLRPMLRSLNWVNTGIFLYFSGSLLLFYNGEVILDAVLGSWSVYMWLAHVILSILFHSLLFKGLWISPKVQSS